MLKIFNLLCAFLGKPHWTLLERGMVQFLKEHELSFKMWHVALWWDDSKRRNKLLFNFPPHKAITRLCLHARKPLSVYWEPEDTLAGLPSWKPPLALYRGAAATLFHCFIVS